MDLYYGFWMLLGSSHSDKEDIPTTPEKTPRKNSERKRKRKGTSGSGDDANPNSRPESNKKINEYFKYLQNSPVRLQGGAKSPSSQQQSFQLVSFIV